MTRRMLLLLLSSLLGAAVTVAGTLVALEQVSTVTVLTVVAGAFGSGAAVTTAVAEWRASRRRVR